MRRKSKSPQRKLEDKIWELCKQITRTRHGNVCFTCGRGNLETVNWHTGHMWAKASLGASLKYDLRLLRPQCYDCNINKGGMGAVFYRNLLLREGEDYVFQLEKDLVQDKRGLKKASNYYPTLLEEYTLIWEELRHSVPTGFGSKSRPLTTGSGDAKTLKK